jgi:hypothetical protein
LLGEALICACVLKLDLNLDYVIQLLCSLGRSPCESCELQDFRFAIVGRLLPLVGVCPWVDTRACVTMRKPLFLYRDNGAMQMDGLRRAWHVLSEECTSRECEKKLQCYHGPRVPRIIVVSRLMLLDPVRTLCHASNKCILQVRPVLPLFPVLQDVS